MKIDIWEEDNRWFASFPFATMDGKLQHATAEGVSADACLRELANSVQHILQTIPRPIARARKRRWA